MAIHILDRIFQINNSIQLLYFYVKLQKMIPTEYWKLSMACERVTGKHTRQIEYHSLAIRWQQTSPRPSCKSIATNPAKTHWLHRQCTNHPCCHPPISLHFFFDSIFSIYFIGCVHSGDIECAFVAKVSLTGNLISPMRRIYWFNLCHFGASLRLRVSASPRACGCNTRTHTHTHSSNRPMRELAAVHLRVRKCFHDYLCAGVAAVAGIFGSVH